MARNVRAVGKACPTLVGNKTMTDKNATRDVASMLAKGNMALKVDKELLAPSTSIDLFTV